MSSTLYEQVGGESKVRAVIDQFVDRMVSDIMIGFFFQNIHLGRLKELEFQHAAQFLGAPLTYRGRPLQEAHAPHGIAGGQFARRLAILGEVLAEMGVLPEVRQAWLEHQESLRAQITQAVTNGCDLPSGGPRA